MVCACFLYIRNLLSVRRLTSCGLIQLTWALVSALSGNGTALGDLVSSMVINEASNGAISDDEPLLEGSMCLIPACVRAEALCVVGVQAPEDVGEVVVGEIAAGVILISRLMYRSVQDPV